MDPGLKGSNFSPFIVKVKSMGSSSSTPPIHTHDSVVARLITFTFIYSDTKDQIKEDECGGACSVLEMLLLFWLESLKGREQLADGKIVLKWILMTYG
jgi:hypothetical protein